MIRPNPQRVALFLFGCFVGFSFGQEPQLTLGDDGKFEFTAFGQEIRRIDVMSHSRSLIPPEDLEPFEFASGNAGRFFYYSSSDPEAPGVIIDGTIALDLGYNERVGGRDIRYRYGTTGIPPDLDLGDGGGITGRINEDGFIVVSGSGQRTAGFDFISPTSALVPLPSTDENGEPRPPGQFGGNWFQPPEPFDLLLANTPEQVTIVGFRNSITVDGDLTLPIGFSGVNPGLEIQAQWGNGAQPVRFPIEGNIAVPQDMLWWSDIALMDQTEYPSAPDWSGLQVTVDAEDQFVLTGAGHPLTRFSLRSNDSGLIPDTSPEPFHTLVRNEGDFIEYVMNDGTEFVLDGSLTLGARWNASSRPFVSFEYNAVPTAQEYRGTVDLSAIVEQPSSPVEPTTPLEPTEPTVPLQPPIVEPPIVEPPGIEPPPVVEPPAIDPPAANPSSPDPAEPIATGTLVGTFPEGGGLITLKTVGGPVNAAGLDIVSTNGLLIPSDDPGPFTFLLSNTADQVTFGNLGSTVLFEGSVTLPLAALPGAELSAAWGDGPTPISFPISVEPQSIVLPEPRGAYSLLIGFAALYLGRRPRSLVDRVH